MIAPAVNELLPSGTPEFWITNETDTITGRQGVPPITVTDPSPPSRRDGCPRDPWSLEHHESVQQLKAPVGMSIQVQVVKLS